MSERPIVQALRKLGITIAGERDGAAPADGSAERWWIDHATLLAAKMKQGGVRSLHIYLNDHGNYAFEIEPVPAPPEKCHFCDGSGIETEDHGHYPCRRGCKPNTQADQRHE